MTPLGNTNTNNNNNNNNNTGNKGNAGNKGNTKPQTIQDITQLSKNIKNINIKKKKLYIGDFNKTSNTLTSSNINEDKMEMDITNDDDLDKNKLNLNDIQRNLNQYMPNTTKIKTKQDKIDYVFEHLSNTKKCITKYMNNNTADNFITSIPSTLLKCSNI